ncbi:MAG: hypothetical protein ABSE52_09780 [Candidatus Dormibacteria bacterium]|jgi:hypothetical protein
MPDDDYRPTHELPADSRPTNVPPEWWDLLDRNDLPRGGRESDRGPRRRRSREEDIIHGLQGGGAPRSALRWRSWVTNLALITVAVLLLTVGLSTAAKGSGAILLLSGIVALLALVGIQVARRTHRRG